MNNDWDEISLETMRARFDFPVHASGTLVEYHNRDSVVHGTFEDGDVLRITGYHYYKHGMFNYTVIRLIDGVTGEVWPNLPLVVIV